MASAVEKAKKKRATIRSVTTRLMNKIKEQLADENVTVENLSKSKLQIVEKFNQIKTANIEVENLIEDLDEIESDIEASQEYSDKILNLQFDIENKLEKLKLVSNKDIQSVVIKQSENSQTNIKVPKFDLPTFNGNINNWLSFKQIFTSTIHDNSNLTQLQKLQYLHASVSEEAARLIKGFPVTDANYSQAWETLISRYDNKRELSYALCAKIFSIKPIKVMSSKALRDILDSCNESIRNLNTLGFELDKLSELIIIQFLEKRLDDNIRRQWELTLEDEEIPSYKQFIAFLEKHARSMKTCKENYAKEEILKSKKSVSYNAVAKISRSRNCLLCSLDHELFRCNEFKNLSTQDRWNLVKKNKLCFNCLRANHDIPKCKVTFHCRDCSKKHHTLLHDSQPKQKASSDNSTLPSNDSIIQTSNSPSSSLSLSGLANAGNILLSTALVKIMDSQGNWQECRALLDSGSQTSLISEGCCAGLKLKTFSTNHLVIGTGNRIVGKANSVVNLEFTPHFNSEKFCTRALVVKELTTKLPNFYIPDHNWSYVENLQLADPDFHISKQVDIILGADIFFDVIQGKKRIGKKNTPIAIQSKLGWVLSGKVSYNPHDGTANQNLSCHVNVELDEVIRKFWELESIPEKENLSNEDKNCEKFYIETVTRDKTGRYEVKLPFKDEPSFGNSRDQAVRRFLTLEKKLMQNPSQYNQYKEFMRDYISLNHMELVPKEDNIIETKCFYMPHHGVIREQSTTTKLRVVFDASARSTTNKSLNDLLHIGPKLQTDLFYILLNFRSHSIVLTADIEKMFRQIRVSRSDADFQRIVWRENPDQKIEDYRLLTVTYGTACAPYLAVRTIKQLAEDEYENFPKASKVIKSDFYVDDLLTGTNSTKEAEKLVYELINLMKKGGFILRKWLSNEPSVLSKLPNELKGSVQPINIDEDQSVKLLGIQWDPIQDTFRIQINPTQEVATKRQLLSNIAKIYDPIGFISPSTILAKIMMQKLWLCKLTWDEPLPSTLLKEWTNFASQLSILKEVRVSRCFFEKDSPVKCIQIHGFCDASQKAYAAVLYMRAELENQQMKVSLIAAKTRVAPLKTITLPRLELCAAVLLSELHKNVVENLAIQVDESFFWTDSQIVLDWIKSEPQRWKLFIANRISLIQSNTKVNAWHHVVSKENPADCASRGLMPSKLLNHSQWWKGPPWLSDPQITIPSPAGHSNSENQESSEVSENLLSYSNQTQDDPNFIHNYSSLSKLTRVMAYCLRFIHNLKCEQDNRKIGSLKTSELNDSTTRIVKLIQQLEFKSEIHSLKTKGSLPSKSTLLSLNPFLDENDILRVGGRLKHSNLTNDQKHPMLIPKNHHFSDLIIDYYHKISLHGGTQVVLSLIRQRFWLISGRDKVRRNLQRCLTCFKTKTKIHHQLMGDLPKDRVLPSKPFLKTGIDFAGPIITKPNIKRTKITTKSYIAIFICFATKAVHLEIVSDLSTESFLACLRRFISRRGKPSDIYSDNATNFKGARNYLCTQIKILKSESVQNFTSEQSINWHFIPPSAPHFGGLWESNIKSMKQHLVKTCKSAILTYEELSTLIAQIEACMNSRPLTAISNDPNDLEPLTPGHFLIGSSLLSLPETASTEHSLSYVSRFKLIQVLRAQFWKRWSTEYLTQLQRREKWKAPSPNIEIGQLVLIREELKSPMKWCLGRIVKTFPGDDGAVRVVEVKTTSGIFKRPITKISPLPTLN